MEMFLKEVKTGRHTWILSMDVGQTERINEYESSSLFFLIGQFDVFNDVCSRCVCIAKENRLTYGGLPIHFIFFN